MNLNNEPYDERPARGSGAAILSTYTRIHSFLVFSSDSRSRLISRPRCPNRDRTREREPMNHDRDASSRVAMRVAFFASRNSAGPEKRPDARTHARARRATQLWSHTDTPHTHAAERVLPPGVLNNCLVVRRIPARTGLSVLSSLCASCRDGK